MSNFKVGDRVNFRSKLQAESFGICVITRIDGFKMDNVSLERIYLKNNKTHPAHSLNGSHHNWTYSKYLCKVSNIKVNTRKLY